MIDKNHAAALYKEARARYGSQWPTMYNVVLKLVNVLPNGMFTFNEILSGTTDLAFQMLSLEKEIRK
jgi:hypothetical protein